MSRLIGNKATERVPTISPSKMEDGADDDFDKVVRETWSRKTEYFLSCVGYCVGLGNIWRFPYVCMRNGGGAFLIPFVISLFLIGLPSYFLEVAVGQYMGKSAFHVWSICPLFKGIGVSINILAGLCVWYYSIILAWTLVFLGNAFKSPLPWASCDQHWNTPTCVSSIAAKTNGTAVAINSSFSDDVALSSTLSQGLGKGSDVINNVTKLSGRTSASEEFWQHHVLQLSSGLDDMGGLPWHMALALVGANFVVLLVIIKGIRSSGKVVYVTATLPYVLLAVILIKGLTLPGAVDGIKFYVSPDFSKLARFQTWVEASIQVFYSLGPAWGGLITMASYNKFHNNCMKDSIILTAACEGTSVFGGLAIFTILGHMAYTNGVDVSDFVRQGPGLAFVVYPEAVTYLPLPQAWGVLFFVMLFTLGLDTQFTLAESILTTCADLWPLLFKKRRVVLSGLMMVFFTLTALVFAARGGMYIFFLVDWYIAGFSVFAQAAVECLIVGWIYGCDRFCQDIQVMIGRRPYIFFVITWKFITPALIIMLLGITLSVYTVPVYNGYHYSEVANAFGWIIATGPFAVVTVIAACQVFQQEGTLAQRVKKACVPAPDWVPSLAGVKDTKLIECTNDEDSV